MEKIFEHKKISYEKFDEEYNNFKKIHENFIGIFKGEVDKDTGKNWWYVF